MSMLHTKFPRIVKEAWPGGCPLSFAISSFTNKAKQWNFEVFGNIFARKKRVLVRLNGAQKALANNPNKLLLQLEK